jgi:GH15 family glucan-1,4-alpha-glucosidase
MENAWLRPDDGIWEVRGGRRHFTHSKVMAWVFMDRAVKAIDEFGFGGEDGRKMLPHLAALRGRIHAEICERDSTRAYEHLRSPMVAKLSMPACL